MATREQCEEFFHEADRDHDGFLTYEEMADMMRSKGYKGTDSEIKKFFRATDTSGDNKVTLVEYLDMMGQIPPQTNKEAHMRMVFRDFDKDGNGTIEYCELKSTFDEMGRYLSEDELNRMMALMDKNADGVVNYEEFIEYMFSVKDNCDCTQQQQK